MMARVLGDTEIREICDYLIPIIRDEGNTYANCDNYHVVVMKSHARAAKRIWKLITYEDYAGELL